MHFTTFNFSLSELIGSSFLRRICIVLAILFPYLSNADDESAFDEISVYLNVAGLGGKEVEAVIKDEEVYLSIPDVFNYLKIKNQPSTNLDSISGFFIEQNAQYLIDKNRNQITFKGKIIELNPLDLIQTSTSLFLKSSVWGKVFDLHCVFDFRSLSVNMTTKLDLPVIRERRQALMRNNISKLKSEIEADTTVKRKFSLFNFGAYDWSVASTQQVEGFNSTQVDLRLGTIIAGGEATILFRQNFPEKFSLKQQHYLWRYVNNDKKPLRQIMAGKIPAQSISSLIAPVNGFQITNTPTTYRRSFGSYTISDYTDPDWTVELYVNNVLLDYVKADASGFYTFQVPLVYGNSNVKLRFFGPWGEERVTEQIINIPYNFLPENEFEYKLSAGILEDYEGSKFSRADLKYGLTRNITLGGGAEYLSSVNSGKVMPFLNASVRLAANLLLSADYTHEIKTGGTLNYRLPSNFTFELSYAKYKEKQTAVNHNFLEERKATISKAFRGKGISGFSRFTVNQILYPTIQQTLADLLLSATVRGISLNLTTYALFMESAYTNIYSNFAVAFRLPSRFTLRNQIQYGYNQKKINEVKFELEKQLFNHGFLNVTYDKSFNYNTQRFGLGLRFDLSFMRASVFARTVNNRVTVTQSLKGGGLHDGKTNYFGANNRFNTGRAGLVIYPYLDFNSNNRKDKNEPKINGLKLKMLGGRVQTNTRDTSIQVFDLESNTNYLLEFNSNNFDNIAWQLKDTTYKVATEANKLKLVEIPVKVCGEVSGTVFSATNKTVGLGRIIVNIYRNNTTLVARTISESDGYFSFLGLSPGSYTIGIDKSQLLRLNMTGTTSEFTIKPTINGDFISNIELILKSSQ